MEFLVERVALGQDFSEYSVSWGLLFHQGPTLVFHSSALDTVSLTIDRIHPVLEK